MSKLNPAERSVSEREKGVMSDLLKSLLMKEDLIKRALNGGGVKMFLWCKFCEPFMLEVLNKGGIFNSGDHPLMCSLK